MDCFLRYWEIPAEAKGYFTYIPRTDHQIFWEKKEGGMWMRTSLYSRNSHTWVLSQFISMADLTYTV